MTDDDAEACRAALSEAMVAHRAASLALERAQAAARAAGIDIAPDEGGGTLRAAVVRAERVEVVEPDGTLRLVMASRARLPGLILRGEETAHPSREGAAGMLFFNDEGTESGGMIYAGAGAEAGGSGVSHLSFDGFERDQVIAISQVDRGSQHQVARIEFSDQPDWSQVELAEKVAKTEDPGEKKTATRAFADEHGWPTQRMRLAREADGSVGLTLRDKQGERRLSLSVETDGTPRIRTWDEAGQEHELDFSEV